MTMIYSGLADHQARENHARLTEQMEYDKTDKQCFVENVSLAKDRLKVEIARLNTIINNAAGNSTSTAANRGTIRTCQPELKAAKRGDPEDNSCPEDIKVHVRQYGRRYSRQHGKLYMKQHQMLPRLEKWLKDAGIE